MSEQNRPHVGLIGLGYWGRNLLRNLSAMGVLALASDTSQEIITIRRAEYPNIHYTLHPEEIFKKPEIQAVALATPATTHYALTKKALEAGRDVFVEKPLALTVDEGQELVNFAVQRGRILMVGHLLQYHPAVAALHSLMKNGQLGDLQYIYSNRLNIGKLRKEENVLWSFAPHDISVMLSIVGEEPTEVEAWGSAYITPGIPDVTLTNLQFPKGVRGHIFVSWLHPYKEQRLVVIGSKGMAVFDDCAKDKLCVYSHIITKDKNSIPTARKAKHCVIPLEEGEPLKQELQHFLACVRERKTPKTDGEEGMRVLRTLARAEVSLQRKR